MSSAISGPTEEPAPAFYPGCSLDGIGRAYRISAEQVLQRLGLELDPIVDYNCCGAAEARHLSDAVSLALPARNLALARSMGRTQVVAACNGCAYALGRANAAWEEAGTRNRINALLVEGGAPVYDGHASVRHLLEYLHARAGPIGVRAAVRRPLTGVKVAPYYGCLYSHPRHGTAIGAVEGSDDPERPEFLDDLLGACGATVVSDFSAKTVCCGGGHALSDLEVSISSSAVILNEAKRAGADLIATICPLGQINIEQRLDRVKERYGTNIARPLAYFTQLMSVAFGSSVREARLHYNVSRPDLLLRVRGFP